MRWKEAVGLKVVDTTTADRVGKVEGLVADPGTATVVAVIVDDQVVSWSDGGGLGKDAFTLKGADMLRAPESDLERLTIDGAGDPLGKTVITEEGVDIGVVDDIDFDSQTGVIEGLILSDDEIKGSRLVGIGSFAVMVSSPTRASGADTAPSGDLGSLSKSELYELAQERDLAGRSSMSKDELRSALS